MHYYALFDVCFTLCDHEPSRRDKKLFGRHEMTTLTVGSHPLAQDVEFTDDDLIVSLMDGRIITVPLVWFPRLSNATKGQLANYEILGDGKGIHWPEIDEDLSVEGLLRGTH